MLAAALFVIGSIPFAIPVDTYKPNLESIISKSLGREVRIGQLGYQLLPFPHLAGTNVTVWSPKRKGEAVISGIQIWLDPEDLLDKKVTVQRVHFSGFSTNQAFIESFVEEWQTMQSGENAAPAWIGLGQISADSITVRTHDNRLIGPFRFDGKFGGEYGFRSLSLAMLDDHLKVDITPIPEGLDFEVAAQTLTPPVGPPLFIDNLSAHGVWSGATVNVFTLQVDAYGGRADGDFVMEWYDGTWQARGKWNARHVSLDPINSLVGYHTVTGTANGDFDFWFKGPSLRDLLADVHINANVELQNGAIYGKRPMFHFSNLKTQAVLSNRGVRFSNLEAQAYDGTFKSPEMDIQWANGWEIKGGLVTDGVSVASLLERFVPQAPLDGILRSDLQLKFVHRDIKHLFDAPEIRGKAHLTNARLFDYSPKKTQPGIRQPWIELSEVEIDGAFDENQVHAKSLHAKGYGGELLGSDVTLAWLPQWKFAGQLKSRQIQVHDILALLDLPPYVTGETTGQFKVAMQGESAEALLASTVVEGQVQITDGTVPKIDEQNAAAKNASWLEFHNAAARFHLENSSIRFETLTLGGYGGRFLARNAHFEWADQWRLAGLIDAEKIALEPLLSGFRDDKSISGNFSGRLAVKFQHARIEDLFSSPVLAGQFLVEKGVVHKADLEKASHGRSTKDPENSKTEFDKLAGVIFAKDHRIRLSNLEIQSPSLHARGKLNIEADDKLKGSLEVGLRSTGSLVSVPLNVSGDTDNPDLALTGGTVFGGALGTSLLGPGVGTIVGMTTGKLFSGLAGLFTHSKEDSEKEAKELESIENELAEELKASQKPQP